MPTNFEELDPNGDLYLMALDEIWDFKTRLLKKSKKEILDAADEFVQKVEFLYLFDSGYLTDEQAYALLQLDNVLDTCYREWVDHDGVLFHNENADCVEKIANKLIEELKESK